MRNSFDGKVKLHHLVARYKHDMGCLNNDEWIKNHPEMKGLMERRVERHKRDIIEYVITDSFEKIINRLDI